MTRLRRAGDGLGRARSHQNPFNGRIPHQSLTEFAKGPEAAPELPGGRPDSGARRWGIHRGSAGALPKPPFIHPAADREEPQWPETIITFMGLALGESRLALEAGNPPVGSIIVRDGEVIGRGQNRAVSRNDPTCHGETDAIRNACRALGAPDLPGSTLYTAMEPCPMCCWAIVLAKVETLVLGARHAEMGRTDYGDYSVEKLLDMGNQTVELVTGVRVAECEALRRSLVGVGGAHVVTDERVERQRGENS